MFAQISVGIAVRWNGYADRRGEQAVRFARRILGDDGEDDLARMEILHTFLAGEQLAIRGKNRGDTHQILGGDARITQCQFERSQPLAVFPHSLGEENPLRNHVFAQFTCPPQGKYEC